MVNQKMLNFSDWNSYEIRDASIIFIDLPIFLALSMQKQFAPNLNCKLAESSPRYGRKSATLTTNKVFRIYFTELKTSQLAFMVEMKVIDYTK